MEGLFTPAGRTSHRLDNNDGRGTPMNDTKPNRRQVERTNTKDNKEGEASKKHTRPTHGNVRFNSTPHVHGLPLGQIDSVIDGDSTKTKRTRLEWIRWTCWHVITFSWVNVLLIFVPAGIAAAQIHQIHGGIVFGLNCVAVIPLAGLLAHATEAVASDMGDALGALMNVTFGNAVELIIFIALTKNKIRVVQASLLGSILANLLLILGMAFFLGGMRYREQLYNSTVTQMSACLLSLSVISLVLPTAFHASFKDYHDADKQSLKISRGTSVVLLLVYAIFLVFQLKSHAYMYESMPRDLVDAEASPGPAAAWLEGNESNDDVSTDGSAGSQHSKSTVGHRVRRALRPGRTRRRSASLPPEGDEDNEIRNSSETLTEDMHPSNFARGGRAARPSGSPYPSHRRRSGESMSDLGAGGRHRQRESRLMKMAKIRSRRRSNDETRRRERSQSIVGDEPPRLELSYPNLTSLGPGETSEAESSSSWGRFMRLRNLTPVLFSPRPGTLDEKPPTPGGMIRESQGYIGPLSTHVKESVESKGRPPMPSQLSTRTMVGGVPPHVEGAGDMEFEPEKEKLPRTAAIIILLVSTGLVAVCAEFLVSSIEDVTKSSAIGETFIGLILLPIVGNAAEHITAITVAMKNKMDLAIGVAIGSSIQVALFLTPVVVILGWIMDRQMSLYFTLFETVCLFVSAFIVNFLVLDGRSNYMEGALLCAVYLIISVVAFFYPQESDTSAWGVGEDIAGDRRWMLG